MGSRANLQPLDIPQGAHNVLLLMASVSVGRQGRPWVHRPATNVCAAHRLTPRAYPCRHPLAAHRQPRDRSGRTERPRGRGAGLWADTARCVRGGPRGQS